MISTGITMGLLAKPYRRKQFQVENTIPIPVHSFGKSRCI